MSRKRIGLSVLAISGMMNAAVFAQAANGQSSAQQSQSPSQQQSAQAQQQQRQSASPQQSQSSQQQQAPEGWVLIQERVVVLTANEPQNHFLRAQQYITQGDAKAAAAEARIGAAYLEMQAARAKGTFDAKLQDAAVALRQQAGQIAQAQGNVQQQGQQLKETFATANAALAAHFKSLAEKSLQSQKNVMAGHDLEAAAESLAAAFAWSGKEPQAETLKAISQAQQTAAKLMIPGDQAVAQRSGQPEDQAQTAGAVIDQKGGQAPPEASQAISQLGDAIQQASSQFQTPGLRGAGQPGQSSQGQSSQQGQSGSSSQ